MNNIHLKIGTRSSRLALTQAGNVLDKFAEIFPDVEFEKVAFSSPGDRDRQTDLKISDPDFFTRDLDEAVINNEIDAAVHSAKDLPEAVNPQLDWFWLPWNEDPRDILVGNSKWGIGNCGGKIRIGVSSERREKYCRQRFPDAELLPIRGNIEERIGQLDDGKYDLLIMAAAGLNRLGLQDRITEYIPLAAMPPPPGQGFLAVTFRRGDRRFEIMRALFVRPVIFAGSGPGDPELATIACINALKHCDVCLYDSLAPEGLLVHLPEKAQAVYVGKRSGKHSKKQVEICELISLYARQGKAVVRLKGGDAGIFGRLAEEIEVMDSLALPYRVIPGISSLQSASGGTGLLLTRRGISRGFSVMTPRKEGSAEYQAVTPEENLKFPRVYFMGKSVISQITADLLVEGWDKDAAAAVVFAAGTNEETILTGNIANIAEKAGSFEDHGQPGLLMVGPNADEKYLYLQNGGMAHRKILVTCSESLQGKTGCEIRRYGGKAVPLPMIKLQPACCSATGDISATKESQSGTVARQRDRNQGRMCFENYDFLLLTSPTAVKIFLGMVDIDVRKLPKIMVCGPGTAGEFRRIGIIPDLIAEDDFGASGLVKTAEKHLKPGTRILRLCSDQAGEKLSCELRRLSCEVEERILYFNTPLKYATLPDFDGVVFASSSAVKAFVDNFGVDSLGDKIISVIGQPTLETVKELMPTGNVVMAREATISGTVNALAEYYVNKKLIKEFILP